MPSKIMFHATELVSFFFLIQQHNTSFHKFETMPINCVLASTVVFNKTPLYKCQFLQLYLFDCCRSCNAVYSKCMLQVGDLNGGPEQCYRESYKCMCHCLDKHTPPEIPPFPWFNVSCDKLFTTNLLFDKLFSLRNVRCLYKQTLEWRQTQLIYF